VPPLRKIRLHKHRLCGRTHGRRFLRERRSARERFLQLLSTVEIRSGRTVIRAMDKVPAAIFRLSSIIGDSSTGAVHQFNHVHRLIRLFPRNVLPIVPRLPEAPVDLIASNWTMAALAYLFERGFEPCRFYHICGTQLNRPPVSPVDDRRLGSPSGRAQVVADLRTRISSPSPL
jgi:hypothetical protein